MLFKSKKAPLLILGITALICSRVLLALFNDPEGPNLVVVIGAAAILYVVSLAAYLFGPFDLKRLLLALSVQLLLAIGLYFFLR